MNSTMDAKHAQEYLREQAACNDFGITRESYLAMCKWRDGVEETPPEFSFSEEDGIYQSSRDVELIHAFGQRHGLQALAFDLVSRRRTAGEAFDECMRALGR